MNPCKLTPFVHFWPKLCNVWIFVITIVDDCGASSCKIAVIKKNTWLMWPATLLFSLQSWQSTSLWNVANVSPLLYVINCHSTGALQFYWLPQLYQIYHSNTACLLFICPSPTLDNFNSGVSLKQSWCVSSCRSPSWRVSFSPCH